MAALFCEEYNKYVADDEKARIVIPYSFLLSKTGHLFPETVQSVKDGDAEKKFLIVAAAKPELFQFVMTDEDRALYADLYARVQNLLMKFKAAEQANAPKSGNGDADEEPEDLSHERVKRASLQTIRLQAREANEVLRITGNASPNWFESHGIGKDSDFPSLKSENSEDRVGGPGLFFAMLNHPEIRTQLKLGMKPLPELTPESLPFYQQGFTNLNALLHEINTDISLREERTHARRKVKTMSAAKKERLPISRGSMTTALESGKRYKQYLQALTPEWLEKEGIANRENKMEFEEIIATPHSPPVSVLHSGPSLFQALVGNADVKKNLPSEGAIMQVSQKAMRSLALSDEETIYAAEDKAFFEEHIKPYLPTQPEQEKVITFVERVRR
ncbi:MAG: hypothetical protein K2Q01_11185 [Rickettsiales bacterium]|nr:hypothetical protein [Rickettsiales bacterium]